MTDDGTVATITKGYTFSEETIELGVHIAGATGTGKTKTLQLLARTAAIVRPGSRQARRGS